MDTRIRKQGKKLCLPAEENTENATLNLTFGFFYGEGAVFIMTLWQVFELLYPVINPKQKVFWFWGIPQNTIIGRKII